MNGCDGISWRIEFHIRKQGEPDMRQFTLRLAPFIMALVIVGAGPVACSQKSAPAAGAISLTELAPGVTAEVLAAAPSTVAPGQTVYVARFVFQPGASIFPHGHPGTTVLGVVSGSFGWTLKAGVAHVIRGAGAGATGPVEDLTEPGADVILKAGDAIFYESDVVHTARGADGTEAVILGSLVLQTGAPLLMKMDAPAS
jgi:quercetin dioxygenase-like cupin family protein